MLSKMVKLCALLLLGLLPASTQIERMDPTRRAVVYCHEMVGSTAGEQINACIAAVQANGGGIADARGITGTQVYTSSIDLCQQSSGDSNLRLLLGKVVLVYNGTGDAIKAVTPDDASKTCRFIDVIGSGRYLTSISVYSGVTAQSLIHLKYTTHVAVRDLTLFAPGSSGGSGQATYGLWDEQSLDTIMTDALVKSNTTSYVAGQSGIFLDGSGYTHIARVNTIGGEYGWRIESDADAVPAAVRTALVYTAGVLNDGNSVHTIRIVDAEALNSWHSGFFIYASAAGYGVNRITMVGVHAYVNGQRATNIDKESGIYIQGVTGQQVEGVQIFGGWVSSNNMHGLVLDGNVARCEIHLKSSENGNGSGSPPTAYQLNLMNGSISGAPSENRIWAVLNATGAATNQAFNSGTNAVGNELYADTFTYTYTIGNLSNMIRLKTSTGFILIGNTLSWSPTTLANLGTPSNGTIMYCSDCTYNSNPCTGSSTGAIAKRINGAWRCD